MLHSLAKEREARYQSAAEFRSDVEAARGGRQVAAQPVPVATVGDTATQYLGVAAGQGTRAMSPVGGVGTDPGGPASPYDDRYGAYDANRYEDEQRNKRTPWIVAGVVVAVLALVAFLVSQLVGGDPPGSGTVKVPSVVGQPQQLATTTLEELGLKVKPVPRTTENEDEFGRVLEQDPTANADAAAGSTVTIVVGTEPGSVKVPDVVGDKQADALAQLREAGLQIEDVIQETPEDARVEAGEVIRTDPEAGEEVDRGSTVTVFVASDEIVLGDFSGDRRSPRPASELINLGLSPEAAEPGRRRRRRGHGHRPEPARRLQGRARARP